MKPLIRILTVIGAIVSAFTVVDAISFIISGSSLADNFFGSGSPVSDPLLEMIPGMTLIEFLSVNIVAIFVVSVIMVACIHYSIYGGRRVRK